MAVKMVATFQNAKWSPSKDNIMYLIFWRNSNCNIDFRFSMITGFIFDAFKLKMMFLFKMVANI